MKNISFILLSFALISLSSCDVNQLLEEVVTVLDEASRQTPNQSPNTNPNGGGSTEPGNTVPSGGSTSGNTSGNTGRSTERAGDEAVDQRNVDDPIFSQLSMSNTQIDQYNKIRIDYAKAIKTVENSGKSRSEISTEVRRLRLSENDEIIAILSAEQKTKYDALIAGKKKGK